MRPDRRSKLRVSLDRAGIGELSGVAALRPKRSPEAAAGKNLIAGGGSKFEAGPGVEGLALAIVSSFERGLRRQRLTKKSNRSSNKNRPADPPTTLPAIVPALACSTGAGMDPEPAPAAEAPDDEVLEELDVAEE